jgi:Protein of unknown function (DUF3108)
MRYFAKLSLKVLALGVAVLGLAGIGLGQGQTARASKPVTLTYAGYMAGLPVFTMSATVTLPAGVVPGNGGYSISADGQTAGNLRMLYPYQASINASGALKNQGASPQQFTSVSQILGKQEAVTLTYAAGGKVGIDAPGAGGSGAGLCQRHDGPSECRCGADCHIRQDSSVQWDVQAVRWRAAL